MQRPLATLPLRADALGAVRAYEWWERALHPFSEAGEHLFVDIERIAWPRPVSRLQQESNIVAAPQPF
jgi:hypothetical protein